MRKGDKQFLVVNFGPLPGTRTAHREEAIMVLGLGSTTYQNTLCGVLNSSWVGYITWPLISVYHDLPVLAQSICKMPNLGKGDAFTLSKFL
jgi:hypothetical protein